MTGSGEAMASDATPAAVVASYLASFSSSDPARIAAHVTESFVNEHTSALGSGCEGRATYLERLPGFLGAFSDLRYEPLEIITDGAAAEAPGSANGEQRVAAYYRMTAVSDGHPIDLKGAMFIGVRDGLITRRTDIWDSLTYLRQIGDA